jgi:hypothetical protein
MKTNIYQKLHTAACQARGVVKGKKVPGMQFNPLLHDEVQKVAMEALLDNGLYPICNYKNYVQENFVMVTCSMRIYDIHLKTGLDNEDGYNAKPFKKNSQSSDKEHDNNHDAVAIEHIKNDMKNAKTIYQLRKLKNYKYKDAFTLAIKKHPAVYKDLNNLYETMETQLNQQGVTQ